MAEKILDDAEVVRQSRAKIMEKMEKVGKTSEVVSTKPTLTWDLANPAKQLGGGQAYDVDPSSADLSPARP